jgi:hypothetical protein
MENTMEEKKVCARCGVEIADEELALGKARETDAGLLCPNCAVAQDPSPAPNETTEELIGRLDAILAEMRNINRTLSFERFSIFNIFGGMFQGAALIVLIRAFFAFMEHGDTAYILWAIVLQMVALTLFLLGK